MPAAGPLHVLSHLFPRDSYCWLVPSLGRSWILPWRGLPHLTLCSVSHPLPSTFELSNCLTMPIASQSTSPEGSRPVWDECREGRLPSSVLSAHVASWTVGGGIGALAPTAHREAEPARLLSHSPCSRSAVCRTPVLPAAILLLAPPLSP